MRKGENRSDRLSRCSRLQRHSARGFWKGLVEVAIKVLPAALARDPERTYVTGLVNQKLLLQSELSFAKTASAPMSLRFNAFITVMKPTQLRNCDNTPGTRRLPREGTLLVEPQMGSRPMVITEIRSQSSLQMLGVQDHEMVQAVSSYRADQAFGVRILPGTPRCSEDFFNVH